MRIGLTGDYSPDVLAHRAIPRALALAGEALGVRVEPVWVGTDTIKDGPQVAGFDGVWFGILLVVLMQAGMILPPVGINLFVIQGIRRTGGISEIAWGALPFVLAMILLMALLIVFPQIALWLPATLN